jgi:hypothetical protein
LTALGFGGRSRGSTAADASDHRNLTRQADGARKHDDPAGEQVAAGQDDDPEDQASSKSHCDDRDSPNLVVEIVAVIGHDH